MEKLFEAAKYKLIYVFRIDDERHSDCLKIGEATIGEDLSVEEVLTLQPNNKKLNKYARARINQYTQTAAIPYELLHAETAVYEKDGSLICFDDHTVHDILLRSGIEKKEFSGNTGKGTEWFKVDLHTAQSAIRAAKQGRKSLNPNEIDDKRLPISFRPEQLDAIDKTKEQFKRGNRMLWYAKMRFGKTLCSLQVIKEKGFNRTLILTHRPVVNAQWFEDYNKIFTADDGFAFASRDRGEMLNSLNAQSNNTHIIYFASMQDLRGSEAVGGKFNKNDEIFSTAWDLIIVDEAHEGTQTELGQAVMEELRKRKPKVLELSGTPFNLLDNFSNDEIYTWDYVMEQRAKQEWDLTHFGDPNPYAGQPRLSIYTYDLGSLMGEYDDKDVAFNFREFFRVNDDGTFKHKKDVRAFLDLLTTPDKDNCYPFSNYTYCEIFRHTLWVLPGVKAAKALSAMLQKHIVFKNFKVVNVAGDGDEEVERQEALKMVRKAIGEKPEQTRTITLSCGRLTAGVTVPQWTGVLMLSGSYSTAASSYMQTIFRVQSAANFNGRIKEDCYAFDFAPDRTLQVFASVSKVSVKAGKTDDDQRDSLRELLNFCPIIAKQGSKMLEKMTADKLLRYLKRAQAEKVVRAGFDHTNIYNDKLMQLDEIEVKEFAELKGIIGTTKAMDSGNIDINRQGLDKEQYEEAEKIKEKKRKHQPLTKEEIERLAELQEARKQRNDAISILRGISIRMPLLIYGANITNEEQELTIDNFTTLVDDLSWKEFMPKGVDKELFKKYIKYYDREIFTLAGQRIRQLARAADKLMPEERIARIADIFSTFRNPDKETVLTPWRVVNMHMGDTLGGYCFYDEDYKDYIEEPRYIDHEKITDKVFAPDSYLLEINSKSGLYPLYLAYNIYRRRLKELVKSPNSIEEHLKIWDQAVKENIFVICMTPMAKSITRRTLVGFRNAEVNTRYFEDLINQLKNKPDNFLSKVVKGKTYWKANKNENMKFKAVVGNPPYQEIGISTHQPPVYHLFYKIAFRISNRVTLITPGRFLFKAGDTPKDWMDKMLADKHLKVVKYFNNSKDIFQNVDIKGGVAYTLRDTNQDFGAIGIFSEYKELNSIKDKVWAIEKESLASIVLNRGQYRFSDTSYAEQPDEMKKTPDRRISTSALERMPKLFTEEKPKDKYEYIQIYGNLDNARVYRWFRKDYLAPIENLFKYKVMLPKANGSGEFGEVLSTPVIGEPLIGYTETFIAIGSVETKAEAKAILKYVRTKLARCMLGLLKVTQDNAKKTWAYVPLQDFTSSSDIDWTQSVGDIDKQLYKKYGLTEDEQRFIETMIKPM